MHKTKLTGVAGVVLVLQMPVVLPGCSGWFMVGSRPATVAPRNALAEYTVSQCVKVKDGSPMEGPDATYYLASNPAGGLALYELDSGDNGAMITNHWVDGAGDHFFTFVKTSHGWEYVIAPDRSGGERLVFPSGTYTTTEEKGVLRVKGSEPVARCTMTRRDAPGSQQPMVTSNQPAPGYQGPPPGTPYATGAAPAGQAPPYGQGSGAPYSNPPPYPAAAPPGQYPGAYPPPAQYPPAYPPPAQQQPAPGQYPPAYAPPAQHPTYPPPTQYPPAGSPPSNASPYAPPPPTGAPSPTGTAPR